MTVWLTYVSRGKVTGNWKSYNWRATTNVCVKICNSCTVSDILKRCVRVEEMLTRTVKELGWRCSSYSNNNIAFNKAILFDWAGSDGPAATSCC